MSNQDDALATQIEAHANQRGYRKELERTSNVLQSATEPTQIQQHRELQLLLGEALLRNGELGNGISLYESLGERPPRSLVLQAAGVCFAQGRFEDALLGYFRAGAIDQIVQIAAWFLETGMINSALQAFKAVDVTPPFSKLMVCARRCLERGMPREAILAMKAANSKTDLLQFGSQLEREGRIEDSVEALKAANEISD